MVGTVLINGLAIECIVGVLPHERVRAQRVVLDVELDLDFAAAARSESVATTVDYTAVAAALTAQVQRAKYRLVETLAVECCRALLAQHRQVSRVRVRVEKPAAVEAARWVGVDLELRRGEA